MPSQREKPGGFESIRAALQALDSRIALLGEKIKAIEKNEEVIGRTLIALNERVKKIEQAGGAGVGGEELSELKQSLEELDERVRELKNVLDMINPLEYARIDQIKELIDERLGKKKEK